MRGSGMIVLYICHFIGDYYLQTSQIAKKKSDSYFYTAIHCVVYMIPFACVWIWGGAGAALAVVTGCAAVSHLVVDIAKRAVQIKLGEKGRKVSSKVVYVLDQMLHFVALYVCGRWAEAWGIGFPADRNVLLWVLFFVVILQPAYITYEVLCRAQVDTTGKRGHIYKAGAAVAGMLILLGQWLIVCVAACAVGAGFFARRNLPASKDGIAMSVFITCSSLIMYLGLVFCGGL